MPEHNDTEQPDKKKQHVKWREPKIPSWFYSIAMGLMVILIGLRVMRETGLL